jgi:quinol monooxygenase YgiN
MVEQHPEEPDMYVTRIESTVIPGRLRQFEAFIDQVYALQQKAPGFRRGGLATSLGFPGRNTSLAIWEDRASAVAFGRSAALQDLVAGANVASLVTPARPMEAFEIACRVQDQPITAAGSITFLDITIDATKAQQFEAAGQELLDLSLKFGRGLVSTSLCRSLSGGGGYLFYAVHTDADAAQATATAPEVVKFLTANPITNFGGVINSQDRAEVVKVLEAALVA